MLALTSYTLTIRVVSVVNLFQMKSRVLRGLFQTAAKLTALLTQTRWCMGGLSTGTASQDGRKRWELSRGRTLVSNLSGGCAYSGGMDYDQGPFLTVGAGWQG